MKKIPFAVAMLIAGFAPIHASAQSVPQGLDLKLPSDNAAVDAADVEAAKQGAHVAPSSAMPDAFHYADPNPRNRPLAAQGCDDASYSAPQVHGSAEVGVAGGNHVSGNYQSAVVHVSKALGSCDAPAGNVGISIGVTKEDFSDSHSRHH